MTITPSRLAILALLVALVVPASLSWAGPAGPDGAYGEATLAVAGMT